MWYDRIISFILRSPLHGLISNNIMLITVTGRKSGKQYTTPISFARDGDVFWLVSRRDRIWWRNLRGGAPVMVRMNGKVQKAIAEAFDDDLQVIISGLTIYMRAFPDVAKALGVAQDPNGESVPADVERVAKDRVMIRIRLA